jgi:hypothetical protein
MQEVQKIGSNNSLALNDKNKVKSEKQVVSVTKPK